MTGHNSTFRVRRPLSAQLLTVRPTESRLDSMVSHGELAPPPLPRRVARSLKIQRYHCERLQNIQNKRVTGKVLNPNSFCPPNKKPLRHGRSYKSLYSG